MDLVAVEVAQIVQGGGVTLVVDSEGESVYFLGGFVVLARRVELPEQLAHETGIVVGCRSGGMVVTKVRRRGFEEFFCRSESLGVIACSVMVHYGILQTAQFLFFLLIGHGYFGFVILFAVGARCDVEFLVGCCCVVVLVLLLLWIVVLGSCFDLLRCGGG